jgi:protein-tyrosine phosphatase
LHDVRRWWQGEPALPESAIRTIAVVCHGNLCRSPFAEALLGRVQPSLQVDSFGLGVREGGEPADPRAVALALEWQIDLSKHRTRKFSEASMRSADLVLCMDAPQSHLIAQRWPEARERLRLLGDFLADRPFSIVDPWAQSEGCWRFVYGRISLAVDRLSQRLTDRQPSRATGVLGVS